MFFLSYVPSINTEDQYADWVSFTSTKKFAVYNGTFTGGGRSRARVVNVECGDTIGQDMFSAFCPRGKCGAMTTEEILDGKGQRRKVVKRISKLELSKEGFQPSETVRTFVNLQGGEAVTVRDDPVDLCCPEYTRRDVGAIDVDDWVEKANDNVPRLPCNMSTEEFTEKVIRQKRPVGELLFRDPNLLKEKHFSCSHCWLWQGLASADREGPNAGPDQAVSR